MKRDLVIVGPYSLKANFAVKYGVIEEVCLTYIHLHCCWAQLAE